MTTDPRIDICDTAKLSSYLEGRLSPAQEVELIDHLTDCAACRATLEQQAAEPQSWAEAEQLLKPFPFDSCCGADETSGLVASNRQPLQIQSVLNALAPTDDPRMLGRLGGYEISGVVGSGGMGVVLKAIDTSLDRTVAIKVMAPHLASSEAARKRFSREAKAAAAVLHPNVIAIHAVANNESLPYLVMPYVRGTSLQRRLDRQGPLPLEEILRIGSQIAAGLGAAHAQGLVHRDIKPANILLEDGVERVTITDFGLARAVDDATISLSGMLIGTPQFMSPEQARGEAIDQRSDLFSLGSVLYAVCTGHAPFRAETTYGVIRRISDESARPIRELNPGIPIWLNAIINRLMSKRAEDRYQTATEVAELLAQCLAHVQQPASVPLPAALMTHANRLARFVSTRKGVFAMLSTTLIALLGMLFWQVSGAPDISGTWSGEDWGQVTLEANQPGLYTGSFKKLAEDESGTFQIKWSRLERRFNGTWETAGDAGGKISLRLVDDEIRGAWTARQSRDRNAETPRLADLLWKRSQPDLHGATAKVEPKQPPPQSTAGKARAARDVPAAQRPKLDGEITDRRDQELVEISIGSDDGIQIQERLDVFREKTYLGQIEVLHITADRSVARIRSRNGEMKRGDHVTNSLERVAPTGTPRLVRQIQTEQKVKLIAAVAPDGRQIAIAHDSPTLPANNDWKRGAQVMDVVTGQKLFGVQVTTLEEYTLIAGYKVREFQVEALAYSPDGKSLAVGTGIGQIKLFNTQTGELIRSIDDPEGKQTDKKVPEKLLSLTRAMGSVSSLAFSPDGRFLAATGTAFDDSRLVSDGIGNEKRNLGLGRRTTGPGRLRIWDAQTGKLTHELAGHSDATSVAFSPDGKLLVSAGRWEGNDGHGTGVIVWSIPDAQKVRVITVDANGGTSTVAFSPDGRLIAIGSRHFDKDQDTSTTTVSVAHIGTGIVEWSQVFPGWAVPKSFLPNGTGLAVLSRGHSIHVLDSQTGKLKYEIHARDPNLRARWTDFVILPQGRIATTGVEPGGTGVVEFWDFGSQ